MSWTYDSRNIADNTAKLRLLVGDTNTNDQLLTDSEVTYILTLETNLRLASARACDIIIAKLARDIDRNNIGMSATRSQKVQHYRDMAKDMRAEARLERDDLAEVFLGGVSKSVKTTLESDSDFIQPAFRRGAFDNV